MAETPATALPPLPTMPFLEMDEGLPQVPQERIIRLITIAYEAPSQFQDAEGNLDADKVRAFLKRINGAIPSGEINPENVLTFSEDYFDILGIGASNFEDFQARHPELTHEMLKTGANLTTLMLQGYRKYLDEGRELAAVRFLSHIIVVTTPEGESYGLNVDQNLWNIGDSFRVPDEDGEIAEIGRVRSTSGDDFYNTLQGWLSRRVTGSVERFPTLDSYHEIVQADGIARLPEYEPVLRAPAELRPPPIKDRLSKVPARVKPAQILPPLEKLEEPHVTKYQLIIGLDYDGPYDRDLPQSWATVQDLKTLLVSQYGKRASKYLVNFLHDMDHVEYVIRQRLSELPPNMEMEVKFYWVQHRSLRMTPFIEIPRFETDPLGVLRQRLFNVMKNINRYEEGGYRWMYSAYEMREATKRIQGGDISVGWDQSRATAKELVFLTGRDDQSIYYFNDYGHFNDYELAKFVLDSDDPIAAVTEGFPASFQSAFSPYPAAHEVSLSHAHLFSNDAASILFLMSEEIPEAEAVECLSILASSEVSKDALLEFLHRKPKNPYIYAARLIVELTAQGHEKEALLLYRIISSSSEFPVYIKKYWYENQHDYNFYGGYNGPVDGFVGPVERCLALYYASQGDSTRTVFWSQNLIKNDPDIGWNDKNNASTGLINVAEIMSDRGDMEGIRLLLEAIPADFKDVYSTLHLLLNLIRFGELDLAVAWLQRSEENFRVFCMAAAYHDHHIIMEMVYGISFVIFALIEAGRLEDAKELYMESQTKLTHFRIYSKDSLAVVVTYKLNQQLEEAGYPSVGSLLE